MCTCVYKTIPNIRTTTLLHFSIINLYILQRLFELLHKLKTTGHIILSKKYALFSIRCISIYEGCFKCCTNFTFVRVLGTYYSTSFDKCLPLTTGVEESSKYNLHSHNTSNIYIFYTNRFEEINVKV